MVAVFGVSFKFQISQKLVKLFPRCGEGAELSPPIVLATGLHNIL